MDLRCKNCGSITSIYDANDELYPWSLKSDNSIYCNLCAVQSNLEFNNTSQDFINFSLKELLSATCVCARGSQFSLAGYSLNNNNFVVNCKACSSKNFVNLKAVNAREFLTGVLSNLKRNPNAPRELMDEAARISAESVQKIYEKLRKIKLYLADEPYCFVHFKETKYFSYERFEFICDFCEIPQNESKFQVISGNGSIIEEQKNSIINHAKYYCTNSKTDNFTSSIIKFLNIPNNGKREFFNFLYDVKKNLKDGNQKAQLSRLSLCLKCGKQFSIDRLPIYLHGEEYHEVCSKCITTLGDFCPIDNYNISNLKKIAFPDFFYVLENNEKFCTACGKRFSFFNKNLPYKVSCSHYICSLCHNGLNSHALCKACSINIDLKIAELDRDLKKKIKFLEIICPEHNEPVTDVLWLNKNICEECKIDQQEHVLNFYMPCDNRDGIKDQCSIHEKDAIHRLRQYKLKCGNCRNIMQKFQKFTVTNTSELARNLDQLIFKISNDSNFFIDTIKNNIKFFSVGYKLKVLNMRRDSYIEAKRDQDIIPVNPSESRSFWFEKGLSYTFYLSSNKRFPLLGFILGNMFNGTPNIELRLQGRVINTGSSFDQQRNLHFLFLNESLDVQDRMQFSIRFSKGAYFQYFNRAGNPRPNRIHVDEKFYIDFRFIDQENSGDMESGGPLLGFYIIGCHLEKKRVYI